MEQKNIFYKKNTMKTLYIIRHAKSDWNDSSLDDFDRPLSEKWEKRAIKRWQELRDDRILPNIIFSSPAKRAKDTIEIICEKIGYDINEVKYEQGIYDNHMKGIEFYVKFIKKIEDKHNTAFIVWHNIALEELASYLLKKDIWHLKTAWIVKIDFKIEKWRDIS